MKISTQSIDSDQEIWQALKEKKLSAFNDFYEKYASAMYGEIKRTLCRDEIAEETLQKIFKEIWIAINNYDPLKERLFTWTIKITRKEIRRQKLNLTLKEIFRCQQTSLRYHKLAEPSV